MNRRLFLSGMAAAGTLPGPSRASSRAPLFLNTVLLGGNTEENLRAAREAGFDQVELWAEEVARAEGGIPGLRALSQEINLGFLDYQVLLDFDGAPGRKRDAKRAEALAMLDTVRAIGAPTLAVPASTDPDCDASRVAEDLAWLVEEARRRELQIAYEGMAWSTVNPTTPKAWTAIRDLDPRHAGLVVDTFHILVRGGGPGDLGGIPPNRIALVQFADVVGPVAPRDYQDAGRTRRLLPGDGNLPIGGILQRLRDIGYAGPMGLEVFNDDMKAQPPHDVARRAFAALRTLLN